MQDKVFLLIKECLMKLYLMTPPKTKLKPYETYDFRAKMAKDYGKEKWGAAMLKNHFGGVN